MQRVLHAGDEVLLLLAGGSFPIGVLALPENGHKELAFDDFPRAVFDVV
ncbi:hypothetical protein SDC9_152081 [bioreactor metagenome]|uniref:Uncharacterized protein n=1 Tax=bioreactor metagenome TaxID=1076179 RepID=A0A645EWF9_9ZZZZ